MKPETLTVTRGLKKIIEEAINVLPEDKQNNKYEICEAVSNNLIKRYVGDPDVIDFDEANWGTYNYQTKRMGVETSGQIMQKIDTYMLLAARKSL